MDDGKATIGDRWYAGPAGQRRAYAVDDIEGIQGGQGHVVRAERRTYDGDPIGYTGPASLKLTTERPERIGVLTERWTRLAAVEHPNLARPLEVFEGPGLFRTACPPATDDVLYVSAVWVDGVSVRALAPLDPPAVARLVRDVAAGLAALHAARLVHRDVHPGNVIVGEDGRATLIDFGSARADDATATTTAAGALGFIPPETLHTTGGPAADRWGLGMVAVFAVLGHAQGSLPRADLEAELHEALAEAGDRRRAVRLLAAMVDPDPAARPADGVEWAAQLAHALTRRAPWRGRRAAVAGAVLAVGGLVAAGAMLTAVPEDDGSDAADAPAARCDDPETATPASPELTRAVERIAPDACPVGVPHAFLDAEVQPVEDATGAPDGVVILSPEGAAVHLDPAMWGSYREIAGKASPENAGRFGGYPTAVDRTTDPDAVVVHLDRGGYLVGRRDDTQLFWLPSNVLDLHAAHGGLDGELGFPMTNPYFVGAKLRQDFEHGYMEARMADFTALLRGQPVDTAVIVDDPDAELGDTPLEERIVRQRSGTAWWVDADGQRRWIPDGDTWECLGGQPAVVLNDLPGYAVADLPLGAPATCP